jgi:uncharacterized protein YjbI with pentapeptide repeats
MFGQIDWSDRNFSQLDMSKLRLGGNAQLDVSGSDFHATSFRGWEESGGFPDFTDTNLNDVDFAGADLGFADFRGAKLVGTDFRGANLHAANFSGADLRQADLDGADISSADLTGANLSGVTLDGVDLSGVSFERAKLVGTNFGDSDFGLGGVGLRDADLSNSNWYSAEGIVQQMEFDRAGSLSGIKINWCDEMPADFDVTRYECF